MNRQPDPTTGEKILAGPDNAIREARAAGPRPDSYYLRTMQHWASEYGNRAASLERSLHAHPHAHPHSHLHSLHQVFGSDTGNLRACYACHRILGKGAYSNTQWKRFNMAGTAKAKTFQPPRCRKCVSRGLSVPKEAWDGPALPTPTSSSTAPNALHKHEPRELSCDKPRPGEILAPYNDRQYAEPPAPAALRSKHNSTREAAPLFPERMQVTGGIKTDSKELSVDVVDQESHRGYSPSVVGRKFIWKSSHLIFCKNSGCAGLGFLHGGQSETKK